MMREQRNEHSGYCPRLIEVALPIREISAESVRDKSLRHGHISTLHLWWARRPLAASRAIVFASLVPDPDDPQCPELFRKAVERHLKTHVPADLKTYARGREWVRDEDPYKPYDGVPDTLRSRLLMFIAKWSPEHLAFETGKAKEAPEPKYLLDDRSLVKWETSDPDNPQGQEVLRVARELVKAANGGEAPVVLDPFAGGGAIPLEAGRLGCQAIANDYNPVAYLILRATCEYPQKYGKPGKRKVMVEEFGKKVEHEVEVPNVLVHDFEKWANWILERAREKIGHLYPCLPAGRRPASEKWDDDKFYVYVLQCSDGSFYKGQTDDMPRRLREHDDGLVDWTAPRRPVYLVHWESFDTRKESVDREKWLKSGEGREWLAQKMGEPEKVVGYLWARTVPCSNPSCRGEIPLLRSLLVCNKKDKKAMPAGRQVALTMDVDSKRKKKDKKAMPAGRQVALTMDVDSKRKTVIFGIAEDEHIKSTDGTMQNRGNTLCPYCEQVTPVADLRTAGLSGRMGERMVAVITDDKGGKRYRPVEDADLKAFKKASEIPAERPLELILPEVNAEDADDDVSNSTGIRVHLYGMKT